MKIEFLKDFKKGYKKLPKNIQDKAKRCIKAVSEDLRHPGVKARKMTSVKGNIWEGRVNGSYRFTFHIEGNTIVVRKIGTHQIYKNP